MPAVRQRRRAERRFTEVMRSARWGLPVCPGAYPLARRCSCQHLGCRVPAAHPLSHTWQTDAGTDPERIASWLHRDGRLNFVSPTGLVHDVLDVPALTGAIALARMEAGGRPVGPVATYGEDRYLFFTATRGLPVNEDEWWPCDLDHRPEEPDEHQGVRWHSRGSYVLIPPSVRACGQRVRWARSPDRPLPDPIRVLDVLVDAAEAARAADRLRKASGWLAALRLA